MSARRAKQADVLVGEMGGVHRTDVRSEQPSLGEHPCRRLSRRCDTRCVLCGLFRNVQVYDTSVTIGDDCLEILRMHGPHAVRSEPNCPTFTAFAELLHALLALPRR